MFAIWRSWLPQALVIAALTFWIYGPSLDGGFVWDDEWYLTTNPLMVGVQGLWQIWFQPGKWVEYYPVQETVQWVQWHLWGKATFGYHLTNVLLHILNAFLVWRLFVRFGLRWAWLGGLLFAIHPVQVESVAWISELKNTLSLPFFLLSMLCWLDYDVSRRKEDYQWSLLLFVLAMLCKITMAPFPAVILLYAWWKRGKVTGSDLKASVPFWAISLLLGVTLLWVGQRYLQSGYEQSIAVAMGSPVDRIAGAGLISAVYFSRCFLPVDILIAYPKWPVHPHLVAGIAAWIVFAAGAYVVWKKRAGWGRHVVLGLGFYVLMLAPFLGFKAASYMEFTWVMDHFLYLPLIGLIGLAVAAWGDVGRRLATAARYGAFGLGFIACGLMAVESRAFSKLFINEETLWGYVLERNPDSWLAHHDLGCNLITQGKVLEAIWHLRQVTRLNPDFSDGHYNLALALAKAGQIPEAEKEYGQALNLNPRAILASANLAALLQRDGNDQVAEGLLRQAQTIAPDDFRIYVDLDTLLLRRGGVPEAIEMFRHAVEINPGLFQARYNLGSVLLQSGDLAGAAEQLQAAVALDSSSLQAHENLGTALARLNRIPEAINEFEAVLQIDPGSVAARDNLGVALSGSGRLPEAVEQFQKVLELQPNDATARNALAKIQTLPQSPAKK